MRLPSLLLLTLALWIGAAAPAHAGPLIAAIPAVLAALGPVGSAIAGMAIKFGLSTLLNSFFGPKEPKDKGTKQRMENGADKPPRIIMGRYGTPGHLLYHNSYGDDRHVYLMVQILSVKRIKGVSNYVRVAGENCNIDWTRTDADGFSPVEEYVDGDNWYAAAKVYLGGQTTADPFLVATFGDDPNFEWTNQMICKGCAYVITKSRVSKTGYWSASPDYFWTGDGMPLYDPRRDSSVGGSGSHRWSDQNTWGGPGDYNPHVQKYNIIRGIRDVDGSHLWGGRAEAYRLPLDYWFAAMNVADQNIEKKNGDIVKRYQTGLEIELDTQPLDVILDLDSSCSSYTTEYGGLYKTWCGEPGLSVLTITDDDFYINQKRTDDLFKPIQETYNSVISTYPEPKSGWSMEPGPLYVDNDYLAADGNEPLMLDLQLPYVTEINQVQRVQREALRESRIQVSHTGVLPPEAWILEPHDVVSFISKRNGYHGDGASFSIASKEDRPDVSQQVMLRATTANAFGWLKEMELDHTVGKMGVVRRAALNKIFTVDPSWTETDNGRDKPAIDVSWDWGDIDVDVDRVKWEVRLASSGKKIAEGAIHKLTDGHARLVHAAFRFGQNVEIHFYLQPISKRVSEWGTWLALRLVDLSQPSAPLLSASSVLAQDGTQDFYLKMSTTPVSGEVTYVFQITEITDGNSVRTKRPETPVEKIRVSAFDQFSVRVATKAADGGTKSAWSNPTTLTINPKAINNDPPTALTVVGRFGKNIVRPVRSTAQKDFSRFKIYASPVNDFASATFIDDTAASRFSHDDLGNLVSRWYWATTVDKSGNESPKFPASNTGGILGTTLPISDTDIDQNPPNLPGVPTVSTYTAELTGDGVIDTGLIAVTTAPAVDATHPAAKRYVFSIYRSLTLTGTYTFWKKFPSDDLDVTFPAPTGWFYKAAVKGITTAGKHGGFSAQTAAGVQPLQYSATVQVATTMQVSPLAKGFFIKVPKGTDANFREIIYFANDVEIERRRGNTFTDNTVRTVGDSVTYKYQYVDSQNRGGAVSAGVTFSYRAAVTADIADNAIVSAKIADAAVSNAKVADNAISTTKVVDGAVSTAKIADNAVTTAKIPDSAIIGAKIAAGAIDTAKFAAGLSVPQIVAALPTTGNFDGRLVFLTTDKKLYRFNATAGSYSKSVDGADIIADSITAGQIAAGAIGAAEIAADAVTASKIFIGDPSNMVADSDLVDLAEWTSSGTIFLAASEIVSASRNRVVLAGPSNSAGYIQTAPSARMPVEAGKDYFFSAKIGGSIGISAPYDMKVNWYSRDAFGVETLIQQDSVGSVVSTAEIKFSKIFRAPATAARVEIVGFKGATAAGVNANLCFYEPVVRRATTGELIVDGTISGTKIIAGSITADKIDVTNLQVSSVNITDDAILPSKFYQRDTTNMIRDSELAQISLWTVGNSSAFNMGNGGIAPDGSVLTLTQSANPTSDARGFSRYKLRAYTSNYDLLFYGSSDITVEPGRDYYFSIFAQKIDNVVQIALQVQWYSIDAAGNHTTLTSTTSDFDNAPPAGGSFYRFTATAPPGATRCSIVVQALGVSGPGHSPGLGLYLSSPVVKAMTDTYLLAAASVSTVKLVPGSVNRRFVAASNSPVAIAANATQTVESVVISASDPAVSAEIWFACRNVSGSGEHTVDVILEGFVGSTVYFSKTFPNQDVDSNGYVKAFGSWDIQAGVTNPTIRARIANDGVAMSASNTQLMVGVRLR